MKPIQTLDEKILSRLQQSAPENCSVVPKSTPVIAFGRFRTAEIATISLNPSYKEFELVNGKNRFHTLDSLGLHSYADIKVEHGEQILDYCERYFERNVVYKDWFNRISTFIKNSTGFDYYEGTACHLDLSQWATKDIWGKLNHDQQKDLVSTGDIELLGEIIKYGNFHSLFLNGKRTSMEIFNFFGLQPKKVLLRQTTKKDGINKNKVEGFVSTTRSIAGVDIGREITLIGWNTYVKYAGEDVLNLISEWIEKELGKR